MTSNMTVDNSEHAKILTETHDVHGRSMRINRTADEAYAIASSLPQQPSGRRLVAMQVWLQSMWVGSGVVGSLITEYGLGQWVRYLDGVGFALTALFVVLAMEAFHVKPSWSVVTVSATIGVLGALVAGSRMLLVALPIYFLLVLLAGWRDRVGGRRG